MCEQGSKMVEIRLAHTTKSLKTHAFVDKCIANIIQMFNDEGYQTVASCCGHGVRPGVISLENGTELILCYSYKQTRMIEKLYPGLHEEMDGKTPPPMNVDDYAKLVNELESKNDHFQEFLKELGKENAELVKKRAIDIQKMEAQWEEIQEAKKENKALETELKLQEKDNERIIQLSKIVHESMKQDRDGQTAGWDASAKVVDSLVKEIMELTKTIDILRDGHTHDELSTIEDYKTEIINLQKQVDIIHDTSNEIKTERDSLKVTLSALRTASKFKQEYDPKWQKSYDRVNDNFKQLQTEVFRLNKENADLKQGFQNMQTLHFDEKNEIRNLTDEIKRLNKEPDRIHGHWHRQTSGYMAKIKNQRQQLKQYQKCHERLTNRINTLYPYIVHGDMDHRKWLRKAIEEHFDLYKPDPKPKLGMGTKTYDDNYTYIKGQTGKEGSLRLKWNDDISINEKYENGQWIEDPQPPIIKGGETKTFSQGGHV